MESGELVTDREDAGGEGFFVVFNDVVLYVEVNFAVVKSETDAMRRAFGGADVVGAGESTDKLGVVGDEGVVAIEKADVLAADGFAEAGENATDFEDGFTEMLEGFGAYGVVLKGIGPFLVDDEAVSPRERLPDGFGEERHEGVGDDEKVFESAL